MEVLEERIRQKHAIRENYAKRLGHMFEFMPMAPFGRPNCWLTAGLLRESRLMPMDVVNALEKENIESRPVWKPMHLQPVFSDTAYFTAENNVDVSASLFARGVCLPSDTKMTSDQMDRVVRVCESL